MIWHHANVHCFLYGTEADLERWFEQCAQIGSRLAPAVCEDLDFSMTVSRNELVFHSSTLFVDAERKSVKQCAAETARIGQDNAVAMLTYMGAFDSLYHSQTIVQIDTDVIYTATTAWEPKGAQFAAPSAYSALPEVEDGPKVTQPTRQETLDNQVKT